MSRFGFLISGLNPTLHSKGMTILYAMCGLAFAGKSLAARRIAGVLDADLVSLDAIHRERGFDPGADIDEERWAQTGRIALERAGASLRAGRPVVVDDTFSYRFQRDQFRAEAQRHGAGFLILFLAPPDEIVEARIAANRLAPTRPDVKPEVVEHIRREFQRPADDEPVVRFAGPEDVEAWLKAAF